MTDHLGPIDFIAVEFPDGNVSAEGLREVLTLHDVAAGSLDLGELGPAFDGSNSHLLDRADLELVAADIAAGNDQ